jgi:hypothetical protein
MLARRRGQGMVYGRRLSPGKRHLPSSQEYAHSLMVITTSTALMHEFHSRRTLCFPTSISQTEMAPFLILMAKSETRTIQGSVRL